jgi:hypothetical protein
VLQYTLYPARFASGELSVFCVGGVQDSVTEPVAVPTTWMLKGANVVVVVPSLTLMVMVEYMPTSAAVGVPVKPPVVVLNASHAGRFKIEKVNASPFGSVALGKNAYD